MTNKEKFLALVNGTDQTVLEQVKWRKENRAWLKRSQAVAIKVLSALAKKGMSQKDLAEIIGISPQQVNKWVKGKENFTFETISKLENALNVELLYIDRRSSNEKSNVQPVKYISAIEGNYKGSKQLAAKVITLYTPKSSFQFKSESLPA
jgi:transcriptional regulator with XRE-family HTH domain